MQQNGVRGGLVTCHAEHARSSSTPGRICRWSSIEEDGIWEAVRLFEPAWSPRRLRFAPYWLCRVDR